MPTNVSAAVQELAASIPLEEARAHASRGRRPEPRPDVNAHIHLPPNFSAFETVAQAVELAQAQGVAVLGCSNYYDFEVYGDFIREAAGRGVFPLFGMEVIALDGGLERDGVRVNDPANPGRMYVCGKGLTQFAERSERAEALLQAIARDDAERIAAMIAMMEDIFRRQQMATGLSHDGVVERVVRRHGSPRHTVHLQERHVCQAFQEVFFEKVAPEHREAMLCAVYGDEPKADVTNAVAVQNELRSRLMKAGRPAYVAERFVAPAQAIELVLELGGIPCYPVLADGVDPICEFETPVERLIANLRAYGFHLAEFIPLRNTPAVLEAYVPAMRRAGIVVTAGTEHNSLDLVPLAPACVGGAAIPPAVQGIFWEGACVVAAHQLLTLHGEPGYVDAQGRLNPAWGDAEERIAAFRALGEAVLAVYFGKTKGAEARS